MLAREVGDATTEARFKAVAEQEFGPDFFAKDDDRFAWSFGSDEPHPRGQLNSLLILSEIGGRGAWTNVYTGPRETQFHLPTVEGVDYPNLGIAEARNESSDGTLHICTYAATATHRGAPTSWKVTQLPDPQSVKVYCDDIEYRDWGVINDDTIEINSNIGTHRFRIVGGLISQNQTFEDQQSQSKEVRAEALVTTAADLAKIAQYRPAVPPSCACC